MSTKKVVLGVIAGVAVGALLGVLLAPDKGSNTRKKIVAKKDELADSVKGKFNEFVENVSEKIEKRKKDEVS